MGLPRFELGSYGPKPQMIGQATLQPRVVAKKHRFVYKAVALDYLCINLNKWP